MQFSTWPILCHDLLHRLPYLNNGARFASPGGVAHKMSNVFGVISGLVADHCKRFHFHVVTVYTITLQLLYPPVAYAVLCAIAMVSLRTNRCPLPG